MTLQLRNFSFLLLLFYSLGCKKSQTVNPPADPTYLPPKAIVVVSGNNQFGYSGKPLDTIVIKVTPASPADTSAYSYGYYLGNYQDAFYILGHTYSGGSIYVKVLWQLASNATSPAATFYAYNHCTGQQNQAGGCKLLDSVKLSADVRKPWISIYNQNTGGFDALYDLCFTSPDNGLAIGEGSGVVRTADGGKTWTTGPPIRTDNDAELLAFSGPDTGLVILVNNYAQFTYDGGKTFNQQAWPPPFEGDHSSAAYYMASSKTIYSVGHQGQLAKTADGGNTWSTFNFNILNGFDALSVVGKDTLYAVGDVGLIVKSTDAGQTWKRELIQLNNYLSSVYFITNNFGFAGGQDGVLIRTTDGGANWSSIKTGLSFPVIAIRFFGSTHGYIVTSGGEIAESKDGGLTWTVRNVNNYGVGSLNKAVIKDQTIIFGLEGPSIYTYDLTQQ